VSTADGILHGKGPKAVIVHQWVYRLFLKTRPAGNAHMAALKLHGVKDCFQPFGEGKNEYS
jgi:hypothetical protein